MSNSNNYCAIGCSKQMSRNYSKYTYSEHNNIFRMWNTYDSIPMVFQYSKQQHNCISLSNKRCNFIDLHTTYKYNWHHVLFLCLVRNE